MDDISNRLVKLAISFALLIGVPNLYANPLASGQYFGLTYNYVWNNTGLNISATGNAPIVLYDNDRIPHNAKWNCNGSAGGVHLGFNRMLTHNFIWGAVIDYQQANIKGSTSSTVISSSVNNFVFEVSNKLQLFGTVRINLGVLATKRTYVGITGGCMISRLHQTSSYTQNTNGSFARSWVFDNNVIRSGGCIGVTGNYMFASNISMGLQYQYYRLGSSSVSAVGTVATATGTFDYRFKNHGQIINANLSYHF